MIWDKVKYNSLSLKCRKKRTLDEVCIGDCYNCEWVTRDRLCVFFNQIVNFMDSLVKNSKFDQYQEHMYINKKTIMVKSVEDKKLIWSAIMRTARSFIIIRKRKKCLKTFNVNGWILLRRPISKVIS